MREVWVERLKQEGGQWRWVPEREVFDVENDFHIDPDNLDAELCRLPKLLIRYGEIQAELKAELARKEEHVKYLYAHQASELRKGGDVEGVKLTENTVKEFVTKNDTYQFALGEVHNTMRFSTMADSWWRAIQKKADLMQALTYRQNSEIKRGAW